MKLYKLNIRVLDLDNEEKDMVRTISSAPNLVVTHIDNDESRNKRAEKLIEISKITPYLKHEIIKLLNDNSEISTQAVRCVINFLGILAQHMWSTCRINEDQNANIRKDLNENEEQIKKKSIIANIEYLEVVTRVRDLKPMLMVSHLYIDSDEACTRRAEKLIEITKTISHLKQEIIKLLDDNSKVNNQATRSLINFLETLARHALDVCRCNENQINYFHKEIIISYIEHLEIQ